MSPPVAIYNTHTASINEMKHAVATTTDWPSTAIAITLSHDTTHTGLEGDSPCVSDVRHTHVDHSYDAAMRAPTRKVMRALLMMMMLMLLLLYVLFGDRQPPPKRFRVSPFATASCDGDDGDGDGDGYGDGDGDGYDTNGLYTLPHNVQLDDA